ncbi:MAG TPA: efflux RND transporter periplasmic adaptor subunit [Gemmatimonadales bacterium]|nr:efflux RND transporter periplasmic adaptor subunit [Gemmatimonadales bacterium]
MSNAAVAPSLPREEETLEQYREQLLPRGPRWRKWRARLVIPGALLLLAIGGWLFARARGDNAPAYRFAAVERGDIEAAVSATGTLGAVTTVQVGTQVSGQISAIYVDFNDRVTRGQLIARIDPTLQQQAVRDAEAGLERSRAELQKAESDYARDRQLYESHVLTASDFAATEYALAAARAGAKSAQVTLDKARRNLAYTSIYAPIDGIVVERNVDVGQTVAASLQAPQLFLIANDLSRMQILASVDESDIGQIHEGQAVHFTVQAYPGEAFRGTVRQVRLQSTTKENVVNYTVVVAVQNPQGKLLPGMTATVAFVTGSATDVLMVANAALRFRPAGALADSAATLWYVGADGQLASVRVSTGLGDGQRTVIAGDGVREGMRVITAVAQGAPSSGAPSPFQSSSQRGPPGPPF